MHLAGEANAATAAAAGPEAVVALGAVLAGLELGVLDVTSVDGEDLGLRRGGGGGEGHEGAEDDGGELHFLGEMSG